jgi:hypothetical protein
MLPEMFTTRNIIEFYIELGGGSYRQAMHWTRVSKQECNLCICNHLFLEIKLYYQWNLPCYFILTMWYENLIVIQNNDNFYSYNPRKGFY